MYKQILALNDLQWLMCHKTQPNQIIYIEYILLRTDFHWDCENRHVTRIKNIYIKFARMSQGSIKKKG